MPDRTVEEAHLLQARTHVVAVKARIAHQSVIVGRLRGRGADTRQAEAYLQTLYNTLHAMQEHMALIEDLLVRPLHRGRERRAHATPRDPHAR